MYVGSRGESDATKAGVAPRVSKPALDVAALRAQLAELLPAYMVPSVYIPVEKMPKTASGKTDRKKLKELALKLIL
jgi:acyl-CoA synthetase (AMP-forming)/AMP-acid ligase II